VVYWVHQEWADNYHCILYVSDVDDKRLVLTTVIKEWEWRELSNYVRGILGGGGVLNFWESCRLPMHTGIILGWVKQNKEMLMKEPLLSSVWYANERLLDVTIAYLHCGVGSI